MSGPPPRRPDGDPRGGDTESYGSLRPSDLPAVSKCDGDSSDGEILHTRILMWQLRVTWIL
eukprot:1766575-Prymnesium_polylepis.2